METLQKLAGMGETTDPTNTHPTNIPNPPPIPLDASDVESQYDTSRRGSRASVPNPLNRRPSQKSLRSSRRSASRGRGQPSPGHAPDHYPPLLSTPGTAQARRGNRTSHDSAHTDESDDDDEFIWGPSHPCFPHPNPHCAPDSAEAQTTRVIRVRRDWLQAGDLYPQYANLYPEILDPLVSDEDFRFLVSNVNSRLKAALDPFSARAWVDSVLGVATGFVWDDLGFTGSKQGVKALEGFIDKWNLGKEREGKDVRVVQVRKTGFMSLDFVVPDPGIDVAPSVDEGRDDGEGGIGPAM